MSEFVLQNAKPGNLESIARCHQAAFPKAISSALGKKYVMKMLSWYTLNESTFLFFSEDSGTVSGYCGGMYKAKQGMGGSASGMAQHSFNQAIRSLILRPWLLFHPEMRKKYPFAFKNLRRRFFKKSGPPSQDLTTVFIPYASLVVIGVDPAFWGKGIGSGLLREFENKALSKGLSKLLLTVRSDNHNAIKLYRKNGWSIDAEAENSTQMSKDLSRIKV